MTRSINTGDTAGFPRPWLAEASLDAARNLLGARLVHEDESGKRVGRIVEVEAYIGEEDQASHARFGRTRRNEVMYGQAGRAYVYLVYGMYNCLNVVTGPEGRAAALLIRAVEPIQGAGLMRRARIPMVHRRRSATLETADPLRRLPDARLASGPGLVTLAFGIDRRDTGRDLCDGASSLRLEPAAATDRRSEILATPRIGIDYAPSPWRELAWRLIDASSPSVSGRSGPSGA